MVTRDLPNPSMERALSKDTWTSPPTTTLSSGAPNSPRSSAFQPARRRSAPRAAARQVKLAIVAPVTNPAPQEAGRPKISRSQPRTISSKAAATGDITVRAVFWSHAPASQLAARAAGKTPPVTNPKYRPPVEVTVAGEP